MALRAGDVLPANILTEDENDAIVSADGFSERFLVDKQTGAVYAMAAGAEPEEVGTWSAADSSIVIGPTDMPSTTPPTSPNGSTDSGSDSPPPLPGVTLCAAVVGASAFGAFEPRLTPQFAVDERPQASPMFKPARPAPARPVAQQPSQADVLDARLRAAELGATGAELEAVKAEIASLRAASPTEQVKAAKRKAKVALEQADEVRAAIEAAEVAGRARVVSFEKGPLGVSLVVNDHFKGAGAKGGLELGDRYSTRVVKLNINRDGTPGQAARSGSVALQDLVVTVAGEDMRGLSYNDVVAKIQGSKRPMKIGFNDVETLGQLKPKVVYQPAAPGSAQTTAAGVDTTGIPLLDDEEEAEAAAAEEETHHEQAWSVRMEAKLGVDDDYEPLEGMAEPEPDEAWSVRIEAARSLVQEAGAVVASTSAGKDALDEARKLNSREASPERSSAPVAASAPALPLIRSTSNQKIESLKAEIREAERMKEELRRNDIHGHTAKLMVTGAERMLYVGGDGGDGGSELSSIFALGAEGVHLDESVKIDHLPSPGRVSEWMSQLDEQEAWIAEDEARQFRCQEAGAEADKRNLARRFVQWQGLRETRLRLDQSVHIGNAIVNRRLLSHAVARWRIQVMRGNPRYAGEPGNLSPRNIRGGSPSKRSAEAERNVELSLSPVRRAEYMIASPVRFQVKPTGLSPGTTVNLDWTEMSGMSLEETQTLSETTAASIGLSMTLVSKSPMRQPFRSTSAAANTTDGTELDAETWQAAGAAADSSGMVDPDDLARLVELGRLGVYNEMRRQQHASATLIQKVARILLAKSFVIRLKDQSEHDRLDEMEKILNEDAELEEWAAMTIQSRQRGNASREAYWQQVSAEEELIVSEMAAAAVQSRWRGIQARASQRAQMTNQAQLFMLTLKTQAQAKKTQEIYVQVDLERQERLRLEAEREREMKKQAGHISALRIAHDEAQVKGEEERCVHKQSPPQLDLQGTSLMDCLWLQGADGGGAEPRGSGGGGARSGAWSEQ